ncbi:DNA polymerase epsilon [Nesidiocoris tenuis]|uniref:DNA polymerase epsilon subunit 3 n=1 Tax=Nesidiocoris tenuis TaxID=355587 RepID=A0ABN7BGK9_9HEMI|nr:DNA polymerase epsilon [Nesidiocoris tenuis]
MAEKVEDLNLPLSVITRIVKDSLPNGTNVSKEARTALARAASVFILYITSTANDIATKSSRKTINTNDVLKALEETEFDEFMEPLSASITEFRKNAQEKKNRLSTGKKSLENGDGKADTSSKSVEEIEDDDEEEEENA